MLRVAMLSVHACPLSPLGGWETGGMSVYVRELSRHLGRLGVSVDVFTRRQDPRVSKVVPFGPNARVVHLDAGPARRVPKGDVVNYLSQLACSLRRFQEREGLQYDVIHAHYWLSTRLATLFQDRWNVPLVMMFHTLARLKNQVTTSPLERESDLRAEIEQRGMQVADRIVAATRVDRTHMVRYYGVPPQKVVMIPCGVDLDRFQPRPRDEARHRLGLGDGPIVLYVGRIQQVKGVDLLPPIAAALAAKGRRDARVLVVGGRPSGAPNDPEAAELRRLSEMASRLGVADMVRFVGAVDHERLPDYYAAADVCIVPSRYESFGLAAIEAMACGTPVVASRVGGLQVTVEDGATGFLVPWRSPELFAEKLHLLLSDAPLRQRLGARAAESARQYAWPRVAAAILDLYQEVLAAKAVVSG